MFKKRFLDIMSFRGIKSYVELSRATQIPVSTISHWIHDNKYPNFNNLIVLADFFDVTIDYLAGRENDFGEKMARNILSETLSVEDFAVPSQSAATEQEIMASLKKCDRIQLLQVSAFIKGLLASKGY